MKKLKKFAILVGILTIGVGLYYFNPTQCWFAPKCPVKLLTGWSCPACGMQRFIHALLHGNFKEAINYNYYLLYVLPYLSSLCGVAMMPAGPKKETLEKIVQHRYVIWTYIVTFFIWFLIRNLWLDL